MMVDHPLTIPSYGIFSQRLIKIFNTPADKYWPTEKVTTSIGLTPPLTRIICNAQSNAAAISRASPGARRSFPPVLKSRHPTIATPALNQDSQLIFSLQNITRITGTKTTYSVVINPAFPAVVVSKPACCKPAAPNNNRPARRIKDNDFRSNVGYKIDFIDPVFISTGNRLFLWKGFNLLKGNKTNPPSRNLNPLNVKGSKY